VCHVAGSHESSGVTGVGLGGFLAGAITIYVRHPVGLPVYVRVRGWSRRSVDTRHRSGDDYCTSEFGQNATFPETA
jgi:hypothetical protein